jgi:hypothetical protein
MRDSVSKTRPRGISMALLPVAVISWSASIRRGWR